MAGASKKRGGKKSSSAAAPVANEGLLDELFVPKRSDKRAAQEDDEDDDEGEQIELKVNEKFAKTFLEQKRKEELNRLEKQRKLYGDDDDDESDSESETEDEDGEQLTRALDADIRKTLKLIRKKDPAIYDKSIAFFQKNESDSDDENSNDEDADGQEKRKKAKKKKAAKDAPLYYKDLVRQQVIAGDVDSDDEKAEVNRVMTYGEEQAKLKQDFLSTLKNATGSDDDEGDDDSAENDEEEDDLDGGLFKIRKKTEDEKKMEDEEFSSFTNKYGSALKKSEVDPDAFLEHYLSSEGWKDKKNVVPTYDEIVNDDEDAEELERAEEFEHSYNFRFEEEGSGQIQTYARRIEDTMRREDDSRKRKRAERKERKALERLKKEEELRRLKNLKQAEIQSKIEKVARLMGKNTPEAVALKLQPSDLEGEFDPEEYDKRMQEVFDEEYYNENDDGMEKPTWDEEEDRELFAGLPVDPEDEEEMEEEEQEVNIIEPEEEDDSEEPEEDAGDDNEDENTEEDHLSEEKVKNMTPAELKRAKQRYLDELYSLDYEDLIGDLKCRFKYRKVKTNDFGLTVDEIMAADDKELKSLVSLKRMAPYLDEEFQVDRKRVKQFKKSLEETKREREEKRKKKQEAAAAEGEAAEVDSEAEAGESAPKAAVETGDAKASGVGKKRKRTKKAKQSPAAAMVEEMKPAAETKPAAAVVASKAAKRDGNEAATGGSDSKKKQRRSKKKNPEVSALKATGLSSSRLESYKLTKPSKK